MMMFARQVLLVFTVCGVIAGIEPWLHAARNPFQLPDAAPVLHQIPDCMHVASEAGDYAFKTAATNGGQTGAFVSKTDAAVCGLYVLADPDKLVELTVKFMHASCDSGAMLAFVDGWELNGQYFPSEFDHAQPLDRRITEFCSEHSIGESIVQLGSRWLGALKPKRTFRSSQNAALLQYRIPVRGSFVVGVRFVDNPQPCHVLTEGVAPTYVLQNSAAGRAQNCTLTALYPATVDIKSMSIGNGLAAGGGSTEKPIDFNCAGISDRLDIGGSDGLESGNMEMASSACGRPKAIGEMLPSNEQAIFCGVTTVRLVSSGRYANRVAVAVRPANFELDMGIATLMCGM